MSLETDFFSVDRALCRLLVSATIFLLPVDFLRLVGEIHTMQPPQFILASSSPRRKSLLSGMGFPYVSQTSHATELTEAATLPALVEQNALLKAESVGAGPGEVVLGADTLVELDGKPLGKPRDRDDAVSMLTRLSGTSHQVLTGLAFIARDKEPLKLHTRTRILFHELSKEEIQAYCDTSEPYDKAGSYGIQGLGCLFVERVDGSYSNVVGLPLEDFLKGLERFTGIAPAEWISRGKS